MPRGADVPEPLVERLRAICAEFPESRQEEAWTGTRWRVGTQTFAHLVAIVDGWPPVYARAAGTDGPVVVLTFQSSGEELQALGKIGDPYFRPPWRPGIVGMFVDTEGTDWHEVAELVTESYCLLAPKRHAAQVRAALHARRAPARPNPRKAD